MKALIIEDRDAMSQMLCEFLDNMGIEHVGDEKVCIEHTVVSEKADAVSEFETGEYQLVILDTSIDGGNGMSFINAITPDYFDSDEAISRRHGAPNNPGVVVIRTVFEKVPTDSISVKSELVRPFTSEQLRTAILAALPKADVAKLQAPKKERTGNPDPEAELNELGVSYGESYLFFEKTADEIHSVMKIFANAGYSMIIITTNRAKSVRERFGLDRDAQVVTLTGRTYPLGTTVTQVQDFVARSDRPVIAMDDLNDVIEHVGVERTLMMISEMLQSEKKKEKCTILVSVDDGLLTSNVKRVLSEMFTVYKEE